MSQQSLKLACGAAALLAFSTSALAEIKVNDNFSVNGYVAGSYQSTSPDPGENFDTFQVDTALLGATLTYKPTTGVVSFIYTPGASSEVTLLDAYVTYDLGSGASITGGKFLSYMGYESFYPIYMDQISYANGQFLAPIPGYHSGVRLDISSETSAFGFALLDSVYSPYSALKGDGELKENQGLEAFYSYKGIKDVTLWAGAAYDTKGGFQPHDVLMFDFWASYQATKELRLAGEWVHKDGGRGASGYNWLLFADYSFTQKFSTAFRLSGEEMDDGGPSLTKYTIAPGVAVTEHLTVRGEYSFIDYNRYAGANSASYFGIQGIFKF